MSAKKKALGRGLGALIEDASSTPEIVHSEAVNEIDINKIETNPFQPRSKFDEEALNELAISIKELGIIQPITVRKMENKKFQLITGERRLRASKIAGLETIPAYIRTADDQSMLEMALVENIQREDLDAIEISISYQRLIEECKLTQETLSERVGKKRSTVTNYLRLLKLPAEIQVSIRNNDLSIGHAKTLINIDNKEDQLKVFETIIKNELSVRKAEELVRKLQAEKLDDPKAKTQSQQAYEELKDHLASHFHTNVSLQRNTKGAGKIVIPFKTDEELERIIGIFDKLK